MKLNRRNFLRASGFGLLSFAATPLVGLLAEEKTESILKETDDPNALTAKRWAMVIEPGKCKEGCKDCSSACHQIHNVPEIGNPKDEVKWIWSEKYENVFPNQGHEYTGNKMKGKPVEVLCNHCDNPACVRVCPTQATFRRDDGIVLMDYHRCIGCRYCMAACPYGARSFNWKDPRPFIKKTNNGFPTRTKGVVEKCNFCAERLAVGQIPACVEACKAKAMTFGDLKDKNSEVRKALSANYTIRRKPGLGTRPQIYYIV